MFAAQSFLRAGLEKLLNLISSGHRAAIERPIFKRDVWLDLKSFSV